MATADLSAKHHHMGEFGRCMQSWPRVAAVSWPGPWLRQQRWCSQPYERSCCSKSWPAFEAARPETTSSDAEFGHWRTCRKPTALDEGASDTVQALLGGAFTRHDYALQRSGQLQWKLAGSPWCIAACTLTGPSC